MAAGQPEISLRFCSEDKKTEEVQLMPPSVNMRLTNHSPNHNENEKQMNSAAKTCGPKNDRLIFAISLLLCLIVILVGAILSLRTCMYEEGYKKEIDYTDCTTDQLTNPIKCKDRLNTTGKECICYIELEIKKLMKAPVTVYYELDSYEQISSSYAQSRDDNQLAGHLSREPSATCGSYTYANTEGEKKPIAPCGQLADAMFNDTFTLQTNNEYTLKIPHGLITEDDKKQFRNPPGNLTQAFKDFAKPINWRKAVYQLDTNPENNGFQNEAFIIWMKTDLKQKPAWRVNHTGKYESGVFPANYTLRVAYGYPPSRYDGRRKFIISSIHMVINLPIYWCGVVLSIIGGISFCCCCIIFYKKIYGSCIERYIYALK